MVGDAYTLYSTHNMCVSCGVSVPEFEPRSFSFNSPIGACKRCNGLGFLYEWPWGKDDHEAWKERYPDHFGHHAIHKTCSDCYGQRLNAEALAVTIGGKNIYQVCELSIQDLLLFFQQLSLSEQHQLIADNLIKEIIRRVQFLYDVGLSYVTLNRSARTLSGGEGQRIRLATQIGSSLSGVVYILDEPSIGLHQRDNDRLIETLKTLRDQGNTVVVVEHDIDTMRHADYIIDMGPAAGIRGGMVTAYGTPLEIEHNPASLTGAYLAGKLLIPVPETRRKARGYLTLKHARKNNLKDITVSIPLGVICGVSGVSGSGKSTLIMDELVEALHRELSRPRGSVQVSDPDISGAEHIQSMVVIDQSPIGRTPRSNPATYLGVFDDLL